MDVCGNAFHLISLLTNTEFNSASEPVELNSFQGRRVAFQRKSDSTSLTHLSKNIHHVRVGTEEDMKSSLDPVSVLILPGRDLAAEDIAGLVDGGLVSSIDQILGAGETREATADDGDLLLLLGRGLEVRTEALGHGLGIAVVVRILDVGLGIVAHHQVGSGRLVNSAGRGGHRRQAGVRHECRASLRRGGDCRRKG